MAHQKEDPEKITQIAVGFLKSGQALQAVNLLQAQCTENNSEPTHWFLLGVSQGMSGNPAAAEHAFRRSLSIRPDDIQSLTNLGKALSDQCKYQEAIKVYQETIEISPGHDPAKLGLAQALLQVGDYEDAEKICHEMLNRTPNNAEIICLTGSIHKQRGDIEKSMACYKQALSINQNSVTAQVNMGLALKSTDQLEEAIKHFQRAIQLNPGTSAAYYSLGIIYLSQEELELATKFLGKAFELNPYDQQAGNQLATVYRYRRQMDLAAEVYKKILEINPNHHDAHFYLDAIEGKKSALQPKRVPAEVVQAIYGSGKETNTFDDSLNLKLEYRAPDVLNTAVRNAFINSEIDILELGCGSGLCGSRLADIAKSLTGTDISDNMIETTRKKNVYDTLYVADLMDVLIDNQNSHDLVIAMDVLCYFGDLLDIFERCHRTLRTEGVFAFSVEKPDSEEPNSSKLWEFHPYGHFVHSLTYIQDIANKAGFKELFAEELPLRRELGEQRIGYVCLFRKI